MWATRYIRFFLVFFSAFFLLESFFVALVDPYNIFGSAKFDLMNQKKYKYETHERINKIYMLQHLQPESLILGSSVTDVGLKPETLSRWAEKPFNLSFAGGGIQEAQLAFQFAVENAPVRTVVLGLELFNFKAATGGHFLQLEQRVNGNNWSTVKDIFRHTVSIDALYDAIYTVYANVRRTPTTHDDTGWYAGYVPGAVPDAPLEPLGVEAAEAAYTAFDQICRLARERGIDLQLFISPLHSNFALKKQGLEAWLARVNAIAGRYGYRIRRFTDAQLQLRNGNAFFDATHFRPAVGDRILHALFAGAQDGSTGTSER
ncbi:MAG: hypothetical protein CL569_04755 [Alphaproteobacteria bacterium]|nr:hypothetical protein [Alphaproteobacteria bacterium]